MTMFQPGMLYGQLQSLEINVAGHVCNFSHHHISCEDCIRKVHEIRLTTDMSVNFGCHNLTVQNMLGRVPKFLEYEPMITLQSAKWYLLTSTQQSFHLGVAQGMLIGTSALEGLSTDQDTPLFPYVIHRKVIPTEFLIGLIKGIEMATALVIFTSSAFLAQGNVGRIVADRFVQIIKVATRDSGFINILRSEQFYQVLLQMPHRVPPSYPTRDADTGIIARTWLEAKQQTRITRLGHYGEWGKGIWIFSVFQTPKWVSIFVIFNHAWKILGKSQITRQDYLSLKVCKHVMEFSRQDEHTINRFSLDRDNLSQLQSFAGTVFLCAQESRHAQTSRTSGPSRPKKCGEPSLLPNVKVSTLLSARRHLTIPLSLRSGGRKSH